MGIIYTAGIMAYIAAVILGLYAILPAYKKQEIKDFINSLDK